MSDDNVNDEYFELLDKKLNKTKRACGHLPCTLGHCKGCEQHCGKGNEYEIIASPNRK